MTSNVFTNALLESLIEREALSNYKNFKKIKKLYVIAEWTKKSQGLVKNRSHILYQTVF